MKTRYLHQKLMALLLATSLLPAVASASQTLTYSDHEPLGGMRTRFINDVFFPAIEKESQGRLKIDAHWGGVQRRPATAASNLQKLSCRPNRCATGCILPSRIR